MIRLDVDQRSPEWERARLGIPTASAYDRIITPKTLKPSTQADTYRNQLIAEWLVGYAIDWGGKSGWMDRGTDMEPEARSWYEMQHDAEVDVVGFMMRDDRQTGGSPDGFVGEDGGVELKCPAIHTHIGYMLAPDSLAEQYRTQVQGYLYLSGREWWDVVSYNPELAPVVVRVEADEKFIGALDKALGGFLKDLDAAKDKLAKYKKIPPTVEAVLAAEGAA